MVSLCSLIGMLIFPGHFNFGLLEIADIFTIRKNSPVVRCCIPVLKSNAEFSSLRKIVGQGLCTEKSGKGQLVKMRIFIRVLFERFSFNFLVLSFWMKMSILQAVFSLSVLDILRICKLFC